TRNGNETRCAGEKRKQNTSRSQARAPLPRIRRAALPFHPPLPRAPRAPRPARLTHPPQKLPPRPERPARLPRAPLASGGSAGSLRRLPSAALRRAERAEDWAARPVQGPGEEGARTEPPPHRQGQGLQLPASPTAPPSTRQSAGAGGGTSLRLNGRINGLGFSGSEVDLLISGAETLCEFIMILQQLFRFSSIFRSAISIHLRRNIGLSAIVFNKAKELDPVQKLFIDKIREYNMKSQKAGGPADVGPEYQKNMAEEIAKIQRLYGGGDLTKFPDFKFEEPNFEESQK
uniref:ATP synthase peripheral stalk subunit F6, mitochondrial n=1 Tax=Terrapene triunguis TaxID=2587831 RepID=A0A674K6D5_9SAUR